MKRMAVLVVLLVVMIFSTNLVFAGGDGSKNENELNQGQQQGQKNSINQDFSSHGDNINGVIPIVPPLPGMYPPNYSLSYNQQVNNLPMELVIMATPVITQAGYERFKKEIIKTKGEDFYAKLEKNIRSGLRPGVTNPKIYPPSQAVHAVLDLKPYDVSVLEPMGTYTSDTQLEEEGNFYVQTYRQEQHMAVGIAVMEYGANVIVPYATFRAYITPSGSAWGIGGSGGLLKTISSFLVGASIAPQYEKMNQKTTMRVDSAVTYVLFHTDNIEAFLHPPKVVETKQTPPAPVIEQPKPEEPKKPVCDAKEILKQIIVGEETPCPPLGLDNMKRHLRIADKDIEMFLCIGSKNFLEEKYVIEETGKKYRGAIGHFERAMENYKYIGDTRKYKTDPNYRRDVDQLKTDAYGKWAWCILQLKGEASADAFAGSKGLKKYPEVIKQ